jgi:hypothetical protein
LRQLSRRHLLLQRLPPSNSLSRRDALRRVGKAAAIGLPIVASILAPTAAEAGSCVGLGSLCTTSPCCTNCACIGGICVGSCTP